MPIRGCGPGRARWAAARSVTSAPSGASSSMSTGRGGTDRVPCLPGRGRARCRSASSRSTARRTCRSPPNAVSTYSTARPARACGRAATARCRSGRGASARRWHATWPRRPSHSCNNTHRPFRAGKHLMFVIDQLLLLAAVLILLGVVSSRASARLGLPVLVLFLIVGMLAGERGIGGIPFDSPATAHALGTMALALILFDGGLQTPLAAIRSVWKPATALATVGVLVTAIVTGVAAAWILDWPLLGGLMIGAIVGSTDAAAVFAQLRNAGIHLRKRLKSVLEVESASNDPMAIFLTIGLIEVLANEVPLGFGLVKLFLMQMGVGALVGVGVGRGTVALLKRIRLQASGMYPVLVTACGLLAFGLAANLGGSGFLAIFIAGTLVGNSHFAFKRMVILFHDGLAWLAQITMFVVLGLLIDPLALTAVWVEGLLIALALMLVARPLAVWPLLPLFEFNARETALVSWVGLRGSVPIVLAIFPLLFELPGAAVIFNVVFFVVLISAVVQGSTIAFAARRLGL